MAFHNIAKHLSKILPINYILIESADQPPQWTHYQSQNFTSYSYPQYNQTYQESPLGDFYQPQWEGNYQVLWGENLNYHYEENNQVEEINRHQFMSEMMKQMNELTERIDKLLEPEAQ